MLEKYGIQTGLVYFCTFVQIILILRYENVYKFIILLCNIFIYSKDILVKKVNHRFSTSFHSI